MLFYVPYCNFSTVIEAPEFIERPHSKELADVANVSSTSSELAITSFDDIAGSETLVAGIYYGLQPQTLRPNITVRKRRKSDDEQIGEWLCAQVAVGYQTQSDLSNSFRFKTLTETFEVAEADYLAADYYYTFKPESLTKVYNSSTPLKRCCKKLTLTYDNLRQEDVKIANECVAHRLVSPNYQGEFEFSVAKNEGVDRYNVTCTYKPYNPYIHVAPNFKGLYGSEFGDGRGLICNGDFSLGQLTSQFAEYELQNKNYQSIFARQIQSMDAMNKIANQENLVSAVTGTIQGTSSGAMTGGLVGGGAGAVVGGVLGGVTSGIAGYADYSNSIRRQKESRSLAWDNYNYNLQNVKAVPYSLTKCTAMTYDNKIFPFVERYDATDEEKKALLSKLRWDGMTVMAIGTLEDYLQKPGGFVKGEILRLDSLNLPSDLSYAIYDEIRKGAYLY